MATRTPKEQIGVDLPEPDIAVEAQQEPEEQVEDRPEWLPEKFKDPSEFVTSYKSLEDELRSRGESQKELENRIQNLTTLVEGLGVQDQPQHQDTTQVNEQLLAAYEADPIGTMVFLAGQVADQRYQAAQQQQQPHLQAQQQLQGELIATTAERVLEAKFDDWKEYGPRVGEAIEKNPSLLPADALQSVDRTTSTLEAIYKQVKYDDLVAKIEKGEFSGDNTKMKQQAQTTSGNTGRPGQASETDEKINRLIAAAKNTSYAAFRNG